MWRYISNVQSLILFDTLYVQVIEDVLFTLKYFEHFYTMHCNLGRGTVCNVLVHNILFNAHISVCYLFQVYQLTMGICRWKARLEGLEFSPKMIIYTFNSRSSTWLEWFLNPYRLYLSYLYMVIIIKLFVWIITLILFWFLWTTKISACKEHFSFYLHFHQIH